MLEYQNNNGVMFTIQPEEAVVPPNADYFGYHFVVTVKDNIEQQNIQSRVYKCLIKKTLCNTKDKAEAWAQDEGFAHLKKILDTYIEGRTQLLSPNTNDWWLI